MQLHKLSAQELRDLASRIGDEEARRESVRVDLEFIADRRAAIETQTASIGPIPFTDMPDGGHLPGQAVEHDGALYRNTSGMCVTVNPGDTIDPWERIESEEVDDETHEPGA